MMSLRPARRHVGVRVERAYGAREIDAVALAHNKVEWLAARGPGGFALV
jgi:hypothetical protein